MLSQLQGAANASTGYVMKFIKPSETVEATGPKRSRPRRQSARKQTRTSGTATGGIVMSNTAMHTAAAESSASAPRRRKSSTPLKASTPGEVQFVATMVPEQSQPSSVSSRSGLPFDTSYPRFKASNDQDANGEPSTQP